MIEMLKKVASSVLALLSCSRTFLYALLAKLAAALLDELFEHFHPFEQKVYP